MSAAAEGKERSSRRRAIPGGRRVAKSNDDPVQGGRGMNAVKYPSERLMTVLLAPVVSEKGTYIADKHQQVIFRVLPNATKPEVKAAVELMFGKKDKPIEVMSVQIVNVKGKKKRFGQFTGRRRNWKKAYVCLKPGQEINFAAEA
jgi:large subunit ribosomal protein L23